MNQMPREGDHVVITAHAWKRMGEMRVDKTTVERILFSPDQTYPHGDLLTFQRHDLAVGVDMSEPGRPCVVTVLYRRDDAWHGHHKDGRRI